MATDYRSTPPDRPHAFSPTAFPARPDAPPTHDALAAHSASVPRHHLSRTLFSGLWSSNNSSTTSLDSESGAPSAAAERSGRRRHHKSASTHTSLSSKPVLVRTYSGSRTRSASSTIPVPPSGPLVLRGPRTMDRGVPRTMTTLPPVEAFSFDGILRAVEPDIQEALDAIAEICARSRLSLADEYGAHLPPQGEILANPAVLRRAGVWRRLPGYERALTVVPEASSSSERLAGGSKASSASGRSKPSAYASLMNVMIRRGRSTSVGGGRSDAHPDPEHNQTTSVDQSNPSLALMASPTTSKQLVVESPVHVEPVLAPPESSLGLGAISSWMPWSWGAATKAATPSEPSAETKLKGLLRGSGHSSKPANGYG